ncbi:MAG: primosome, DnaD subunit [Bacillales bacterium]|jgi:DNA replication protein|nr:primosome, DnaD subunit [Bacillales bacterium]
MNKNLIDWIENGIVSFPRILLNKYKDIGLNETELIVVLHIYSSIQEGKFFPTPDEISKQMTISLDECAKNLRSLMQRGYIQIEQHTSENNMMYEKYSLTSLWEKICKDEEVISLQLEKNKLEDNVFQLFENEFGRTLSPIEYETIQIWIEQDKYDFELIKAALREAVLLGKINFRYIDRILFEWDKKGIKTVKQANEQGSKFRSTTLHKNVVPPVKKIPFYNWLESEE